jgi:voltage-gated potassium channel
VDVVVRVALTPRGQRWEFIRNHPIDVGSAILPVFRALKVVDLFRGLPWLHGRTPSAIRFEVVVYAVAYVAVFVVFVALAALEAERSAPGATITDFPEALWWSATSLTTGAYGEIYPVTWPGRLYAVLLMASGLVLFGVAAGVTGSYVFERTRNLGKDSQ